jgi:hypothetical protein
MVQTPLGNCSINTQIPDYRAVPDPVGIWADLSAKYGFPVVNIGQMRVTGTPDAGLVTLGKKISKKSSKKPVPEAKASTPRKGQESPETKVSTPMVTRQRASGAGSLRSGGASGQTGTCVAQGNPPKT